MSPTASPESWCDEWRRLTEAESGAIEAGDWEGLLRLQAAKQSLQSVILEADSRAGAGGGHGPAAGESRGRLEELIRLESRNREVLAGRIAAARAEQASLEQSRRNLQRLQRSFAGSVRPAAWQRYS